MTTAEAYIVAATRTPVGRRNGGLAAAHPADLAAHVLRDALGRAGVPADAVDDVILGCVDQAGAQASNIARVAVLSAGLPVSVPATPSTGSAARPSRRCTSAPRPSCPARRTSWSRAGWRT